MFFDKLFAEIWDICFCSRLERNAVRAERICEERNFNAVLFNDPDVVGVGFVFVIADRDLAEIGEKPVAVDEILVVVRVKHVVVCKIEHVKAQVAERVARLFGRVEGGISADFTLSTADQRFDVDIGNIGIPDYRRNV